MKTTLEHWLAAQAGFALLDTVRAARPRRDILREITRELEAAQRGSTNVRFQQKCAGLLDVVALELVELAELEPAQAVAA